MGENRGPFVRARAYVCYVFLSQPAVVQQLGPQDVRPVREVPTEDKPWSASRRTTPHRAPPQAMRIVNPPSIVTISPVM